MVIKVAQVLDEYTVVLNKGSDDAITDEQRFLIYAIGDEVTDPDTGKSLGALEIIKGTGRVTHVQAKMCTVASDMVAPAGRTIRRTANPGRGWLGMLGTLSPVTEEVLPAETIPLEDPRVGDLAKMI